MVILKLNNKHCVPCEGGMPPLSRTEIDVLMKDLIGWKVFENKEISKEFHFEDFKQALSFVQEVGDIAEFEGHHPDIHLHNWNKVTITLSTHAIKGLSENDFIMAAKIDTTIDESK